MELLISVVIIFILFAIAIPVFLGLRDKATKGKAKKKVTAQKSQKEAGGVSASSLIEALPPLTESADVHVKLTASHHIHNLKVYTRFDAALVGRYVFQNKSTNKDIKLFFPFPAATTHARDVSLKFIDPTGNSYEPDGVIYTLSGIKWIGPLQNDESLRAEVTYGAQGHDKFIYEGPGADRAGVFRVVMELDGVTSELISTDALQPTKVEDGIIEWDYENLVTEQNIVVELPGAKSPLGRIMLFLKLAGLAVFLFGLGFMYLSDLEQPGQLDDFRWGHFLLLSLTYSLFFLIFTIIGFSGGIGTGLSIVLSLILSLPLLMIHTGRFMSMSFALSRVLPLSLFTFAIVINGVYGGIYRKYILIAIIVITVAIITLTYRVWTERKKSYRDEKKQREREREQEEKQKQAHKEMREMYDNEAFKVLNESEELLKKAQEITEEASILLEYNNIKEHLGVRGSAEEQFATLTDIRTQYDNMKSIAANIPLIEDADEHKRTCLELTKDGKQQKIRLQHTIERLSDSIEELSRLRKQIEIKEKKLEDAIRCISCGAQSPPSIYCPMCGVLRPVELVCHQCNQVYRLPIHLIDIKKIDTPVHCPFCGKAHDSEAYKQLLSKGEHKSESTTVYGD